MYSVPDSVPAEYLTRSLRGFPAMTAASKGLAAYVAVDGAD